MNRLFIILFSILCLNAFAQEKNMSLAGSWHLRLDSADIGIREKWYLNFKSNQSINLPGTLDDRGIGSVPKVDTSTINQEVLERLTRRHQYTGAAWYSRQFSTNEGGSFEISLERVIWKTDCWIDGIYIGYQNGLTGPQRFMVNNLKKGKHEIVLRIDNRKQFDISYDNMATAYTNETQIIWNGVLGAIRLTHLKNVDIKDLQVYREAMQNTVIVKTTLGNVEQKKQTVSLKVQVFDGENRIASKNSKCVMDDSLYKNECYFKFSRLKLWDEFHPHLYTIKVAVLNDQGAVIASQAIKTGFRSLTNLNSKIQVNGRRIFLRGTLDCNVYPLKGYAPMDAKGWRQVFSTAKNYGLNHIRFHSWCPPEAAFAVADSMGFYLHVELPLWSLSVGKDKPTLQFLQAEAERIIHNYGNHPSFCFWSMGNELEGDFNWLNNLVQVLKAEDPRHLYTSSTFSFQKGHGTWPEPVADYFVTQYTKNGWVRGQGIFNTTPPNFQTDYTKAVNNIPVPLIIHEMGQYSVYPDLSEIKDYTGVLAPNNFKAIRHDLAIKNMLALDSQFVQASGKLALLLYKEEIERALKTNGISGFQLLDLHDFPGQGTALVGLLNAFWKSKGLISPGDFRMFCSPIAPLLRFKKASYANTETFTAAAQIANFGPKAFKTAAEWAVYDARGRIIFGGKLRKQTVAIGNQNALGNLSFNLSRFKTAQQLSIKLFIPGTTVENQWRIWVYPSVLQYEAKQVKFTTSPDEALKYLADGDRVILNPDTAKIAGIKGRFAPVFWSPIHFSDQPGTMGLLCDVKARALQHFPTAEFSDWQWWDLVTFSKALVIDSINYKTPPIVRVIDNFFKNKKLADIVEFRVGNGRLILCSMDIHTNLENRIEARQLRYSLMEYANGNQFNPQTELGANELKRFFK
ncbi:MAG: sugar-binding domain-containing protein [Mucilaginibacter sp.]